jgi:hypothetical protein
LTVAVGLAMLGGTPGAIAAAGTGVTATSEEASSDGTGLGSRSTSLLTPDGGDKPDGGLPVALAWGVIGVTGSQAEGYIVTVASGTNPEQTREMIVEGLPADEAGKLEVRGSAVAAADIAEAWDRVQQRDWVEAGSTRTYAIDLDPVSGRIVIDLYEPDGRIGAAERDALLAINPDLIEVHVSEQTASRASRSNDTSPHFGGASISGPGGTCTSGFSVTLNSSGNDKGITAGHCGSNGDAFSSGSYFFGDLVGKSNFPTYDQARLSGSTYAAGLYTDGADTYSIRFPQNANDGAVGDLICLSGATTRSVCNVEIKSLTASFCDAAGCTTYVMRGKKADGGVIAHLGDSGGPVYHRNSSTDDASIRGMIFALDQGGVRVYAERYNSIAGHLGVTALLH